MYGRFADVWRRTWREIWAPLGGYGAPPDLYSELYGELARQLRDAPSSELLAERLNDEHLARKALMRSRASDFVGEAAIVRFLEEAHGMLLELENGDDLALRYAKLLRQFVDRFSLRYEVSAPCVLSPTLPGMFWGLFRELEIATRNDAHLGELLHDFEHSIRDLREGGSEVRVRTALQKQINLLEGLGSARLGANGGTLGRICDDLRTWPHLAVKDAMKQLYRFTCDYPGIRHAGTPENMLRPIETRDVVALSIVLAGFVPYLTDRVDASQVYGR